MNETGVSKKIVEYSPVFSLKSIIFPEEEEMNDDMMSCFIWYAYEFVNPFPQDGSEFDATYAKLLSSTYMFWTSEIILLFWYLKGTKALLALLIFLLNFMDCSSFGEKKLRFPIETELDVISAFTNGISEVSVGYITLFVDSSINSTRSPFFNWDLSTEVFNTTPVGFDPPIKLSISIEQLVL